MNLIPTNIIKNMDLPNIKVSTLRNVLALVLITILVIFSPFYLFYIKPVLREGIGEAKVFSTKGKRLSYNWLNEWQGRSGGSKAWLKVYVGGSGSNTKEVRIPVPSRYLAVSEHQASYVRQIRKYVRYWRPPNSTWGKTNSQWKDIFDVRVSKQYKNAAIIKVRRLDSNGGWGMGLYVPIRLVFDGRKTKDKLLNYGQTAPKKVNNQTMTVDVRNWKQNQKNSFKFRDVPRGKEHPLKVFIKNRRLPISFTSNSGSISRNGRSQYFRGASTHDGRKISDTFRIDKINENEFHVYRTDGSNRDCKTNCRNKRWGQKDFKLEVVYGSLVKPKIKYIKTIDVSVPNTSNKTPWTKNAKNTIVIGNISSSGEHPKTINFKNGAGTLLPINFISSSGNITADKKTQYFKDGNDNFKIVKKSNTWFEVYRTDRGQTRWNQNLKLGVAYGTIPVKAAPHTHDFPSKSYVMAQDAKRASNELKERNKLRAEYQKYPGLWKGMVDKTSTDIRTAVNKEIQDKARFASQQRNLIRREYRPKLSKLEGEAKDDRSNLTSKLAAYDKKIDGLGKKYLKAYIPDNKDYHFQYFKESPDSYEPTPQEIKDFTSSKIYKDYATWYGFNKDYYNLKPSDLQKITKIVAHETIKAHEGIHLAAKKHGFFPYGEKTVTSTGGMNGPWWAPRITGVENDKDKDR